MDGNKNRKSVSAPKPAGVQTLSPTQYEQVRQAVQQIGHTGDSPSH